MHPIYEKVSTHIPVTLFDSFTRVLKTQGKKGNIFK